MKTLALALFTLTTIALAVSFIAATLTGTVKDPFCHCTNSGGIGGTGIYGPTAGTFDTFLTTDRASPNFRLLAWVERCVYVCFLKTASIVGRV
jgi:hypothetical protein